MKHLKQEIIALWKLLVKQLPRLRSAVLTSHGNSATRIFVWKLLTSIVISVISFLWVAFNLRSVSFEVLFRLGISTVPNATILSLAWFLLFGFGFGIWVFRQLKKEQKNWHQWWEFFFLCTLPFQLS